MRTIGELYDSHIYGDIEFPESSYFYGNLPKSFQEIIAHVKASPKMLGRFKPDNKYFWWSLGGDQMWHHLTHYLIIYLVITR